MMLMTVVINDIDRYDNIFLIDDMDGDGDDDDGGDKDHGKNHDDDDEKCDK